MKREKYYLQQNIIDTIYDNLIYIYKHRFSQQKLLNLNEFKRLLNSKAFSLSEENIKKLWYLGFVNADILTSKKKLNITGLELVEINDYTYTYIDKRALQKNCQSNCLKNYKEIEDINLYFYETRLYVFYHIKRILKQNINFLQILNNDAGFEKLNKLHIDFYNNWIIKNETEELFKYWNMLSTLCNIIEPITHQIINNRITWDAFNSNYETTLQAIEKYKLQLLPFINHIGEDNMIYYMNEITSDSESLDKNKYLHIIIRLMKYDERKKIADKIGASMLLFNMAEILRRGLELATNKKYDEEDERGFGQVFKETKFKIQGGDRVLDNDRSIKNQFLRRFGLDYNIRVRVYVEGETEYSALKDYFKAEYSIEIINLKGRFKQIREFLRIDTNSKIFSIVVLDGDRKDNIRTLEQALKADELCGGYLISSPDFEIENFGEDLPQIIFNLQRDKLISLSEIEKATIGFQSGKDFFDKLKSFSNQFYNINKGEQWGQNLMNFAIKNNTKPRKLYDLIDHINKCNSIMYVPSEKKYVKL